MELSEKDQVLIQSIQGDLPHDLRPFLILSQKLGWTEDEILSRIRIWMDQGVIKRFGALVRHQNLGFTGNAMVAWAVLPSEAERIGQQMARYPFISHCYERPTRPDWPYNIYTMCHASDKEELEKQVKMIAESTGISDYRILHTVKEWKKKSMEYVL